MAVNLQEIMVGSQLRCRALGCSRVMTTDQHEKVADLFQADQTSVKGRRQIISNRHPLIQAVNEPMRHAVRLWREHTVKYEDGIRLLRIERVTWMNEEIGKYQAQLQHALNQLRVGWPKVIEDARARLAELFVEDDYVERPDLEYGIDISYMSITPDDRLMQIAPEIYEAEKAKIAARFREAAEVAEAAMVHKMNELVANLLDRLAPTADGERPKRLPQKAIDGLLEFADRFSELSVSDSAQLNEMVARVRTLAEGVDVKDMADRQQLREQLTQASGVLVGMIERMPKRQFKFDVATGTIPPAESAPAA